MAQEIVQYLSDHPRAFFGVLAFIVLLAGLGLWYVITHYLQVILITLLCTGGLVSAIVVLYRGVGNDLKDLIGIGLFLLIVFPIIFWQAIRLSYAEPPPPKGADKQPRKPGAQLERA